MTASATASPAAALELETDVLVIGGGPAAVWAALTARGEGARVLLVDKGFCGTSGVAAAATAGCWWVPPEEREEAIAGKDGWGCHLSERSWMERTLEETWRRWPDVGKKIGYPSGGFMGANEGSESNQAWLVQGPVYMREMRRRVSHSGVRILDQTPALELLVDADGAVCGAAGVQRQKARPWRALARSVILATGGCCWRSGALGSNVDTGDGYLMAAEVGATLSGMEFNNYYGVVPAGASMDKNGYCGGMTFTDADGNVLMSGYRPNQPGPGGDLEGPRSWITPAALEGPVYAILDGPPARAHESMRSKQPNFFTAYDRMGIDPFTDRFEVEYILEGLTRGTGGLHVFDENCWTGIPGLWAAGDAVSREKLVGAATGGGSANAAFVIASGTWTGKAAAAHALAIGHDAGYPAYEPAGRVGLRPSGRALPRDAWREMSEVVKGEMLPPEKNAFRNEPQLTRSLETLDGLWSSAEEGLAGEVGREQVWARETAAMIANGRWCYRAARERTESRGMHQRTDFPQMDPQQRHRILIDGVDDPQLSTALIEDPVVPYTDELAAQAG